jgi:hypothetical protein
LELYFIFLDVDLLRNKESALYLPDFYGALVFFKVEYMPNSKGKGCKRPCTDSEFL